uniref:TRAF-type domain-containing protein n=1 Tax=Globisporangium ultimum (strain ATCC 200006 / CBS 805.95 / DAOM BR144) TaxID=431595 RepID=K3X316_GLOUD
MVQCLRPGCLGRFQALRKQQHDQNECVALRHTRKLLQSKEDGATLVPCDLCHSETLVPKRFLQRHQLISCARRIVSCHFAEWGCADTFPFDEREQHEVDACVVAKRKQQIATDALLVNEVITCDWCKEIVKKRHLLDHQEEECLERERPCPNAENGCPEWVPVGKFDEHLRTVCCVTLERNALAARAREKNSLIMCHDCGVSIKLRRLDRHLRDECVSRIVDCKNAAHGCKARLRWRDRHLHEDFMALSRDRSMLQFETGGSSYIAVRSNDSSTSSLTDLPPPWTAEYFLWMVDADKEILDLLKSSLQRMETVVLQTRELSQWQQNCESCKKKLKELKHMRSQTNKSQVKNLTGAELSLAAKELADSFHAAETGVRTSQKAITLAKGWIQIFVTEAKRIFQEQEKHDAYDLDNLKAAIADQTAQMLEEKPVLVELLPKDELAMLSDLEVWARHVATPGSKSNSPERQQILAEQTKLLKKRAELQDLVAGLDAEKEAEDAEDGESERLRRRYERELAKVDGKLALVSENTPTELLERRGRHIIASSSRNAIALVAGSKSQVTFYRSGLPSSSKAAREVHFDVTLKRNQWHHVALCASKKELSVFLDGELKTIKRGVFDLPFATIGARDGKDSGGASFQGFVQEIRYWRECRSAQQLRKHASTILHVAKCKQLAAYWTFEEGMGELVDDMSLSLPRVPCFHTKWMLYDTPAIRKRFGIPPTPSLRDQTCCIINQKLKMLAQRARDRDHEVVRCRQHCDELVPLRRLEQHHRLECPYRMVVCKEIGCGGVYQFVNEAQHLKETCERHLYREELVRKYREKEEMEVCVLNCGLVFKKRVSETHYHSECISRFIPCPREDCSETIVAKTLEDHLQKDCRSRSLAVERALVARARERQNEKLYLKQTSTKVAQEKKKTQ